MATATRTTMEINISISNPGVSSSLKLPSFDRVTLNETDFPSKYSALECAPESGQVVKLLDQLEDAHEKEKKDIMVKADKLRLEELSINAIKQKCIYVVDNIGNIVNSEVGYIIWKKN